MLNKLDYYRNHYNESHERYSQTKACESIFSQLSANLERYILSNNPSYHIQRANGGTLGITWVCLQNETPVSFLKTHLTGEKYRAALLREYKLLKDSNLDHLSVQKFILDNNVFLSMDFLNPCQDITPDIAHSLIHTMQRNLQKSCSSFQNYSIYDIYQEACKELPQLVRYNRISSDFAQQLKLSLNLLEKELPKHPLCICHGDFGDRNIMINSNEQLVTIDWEDGFWGIDGYDYLYWLTFFNHRKFYKPEVFKNSGLHEEFAKEIIVMILIIKSAISFYSGTDNHNILTPEERILEILRAIKE